jgi:transcription elongation factor S-II
LEKAIFEASHHYAQEHYIARNWKSDSFSEVYRQRMMSILSNLHPESPVQNTRLLRRVQEGEFTLASLATMTAYEMFPEKWFALKDKLLQREQKILEGNKSRATDQFKCRRCQKRECTYYELQTRSADEPMTIFITCLNCGKEWRQGG